MLCPPCWQLLQLDTFRLVKAWLKTCCTVQGSPWGPEGSRVRAQTARQFFHADPHLYGGSVRSSPRSWAEAGPATSLRGAAWAGWTYPLQLVLPLIHHLFLAPGEDGLAARTYWFCILIWQGVPPLLVGPQPLARAPGGGQMPYIPQAPFLQGCIMAASSSTSAAMVWGGLEKTLMMIFIPVLYPFISC